MPDKGGILLIGRPHDIDGLGSALAQGLALRGRTVAIACLWAEGLAMGQPAADACWSLVRRYVDRADDVGLALVVRNVVTRPEGVRFPLLWASDRVEARPARWTVACASAVPGSLARLDRLAAMADLPPRLAPDRIPPPVGRLLPTT